MPFTAIALDILQAGVMTTAELCEIMLRDRVSAARMARKGLAGYGKEKEVALWSETFLERKAFYAHLARLKREGLITGEKRSGGTFLKLTQRGKIKVAKQNEIKTMLSTQTKIISPTVISYDIPEILRRERRWLREILSLMEFTPVHKSVWIGNRTLPEKFIHSLRSREILKYVELFAVSKKGTLEKVEFSQ
jgi:DNA-binding transcriptional regulator PaaX